MTYKDLKYQYLNRHQPTACSPLESGYELWILLIMSSLMPSGCDRLVSTRQTATGGRSTPTGKHLPQQWSRVGQERVRHAEQCGSQENGLGEQLVRESRRGVQTESTGAAEHLAAREGRLQENRLGWLPE